MTFEELKIGDRFDYTIGSGPNSVNVGNVKISDTTWRLCDGEVRGNWYGKDRVITSSHGGNMFKDISNDLKGYLTANKDLIYTIIIVMIIDQYIFGGAFRERLKGLIDKLLGKAERTIEGTVTRVE